MKKLKRHVVIPLLMLVYLAVMAYISRQRLADGEYLYYFGVIGISLAIIVLLYFVLKKKERLRQEREESYYGKYVEGEEADKASADETTADESSDEKSE